MPFKSARVAHLHATAAKTLANKAFQQILVKYAVANFKYGLL
jgi:hypothetical protein